MFFTKFLIIDLKKQKSSTFNFNKKVNIITASINKGGKSSLLKSLYFTLGIEQKNFKPEWNYKDMLFVIYYQHNGNKGIIARKDSNFYIGENEETLEVKSNREYSKWFLDLMQMNIKVPFKNDETRQSIYASTLWAIFYIDQDTSWSDGIYKKTINRYMYGSDIFPKEILEYLLGIKNILDIEKKELLSDESQKYNANKNKISMLSELQSQFITNTVSSIDFNEEQIKLDIEEYLQVANTLNAKISSFQSSLYSEQVKLDTLKIEKRELQDIIKQSNILYTEYSNTICKSCKNPLDNNYIKDRITLDTNVIAIKEMILELDRSINKIEINIEEHKKHKLITQDEYRNITCLLKANQEKLSLKEYLEANANTQLNKKYFAILNNLTELNFQSNQLIQKLELEIKASEKKLTERSKIIKDKYNLLLNTLSNQHSISLEANHKKFLEFSEMKNSGSTYIELYILYYMVYTKLLLSYSTVDLPFGLDTIVKDDLTEESIQNLYQLIESTLFKSTQQVFFVALENRIPYFKNQKDLTIVKVDNEYHISKTEWVLSSQFYNTSETQNIIRCIEKALS